MKINITLLFVTIFLTSMTAQVVINEYSASNLTKYVDQFDKTEDWIELYNSGSSAVIYQDGTYRIKSPNQKNGRYQMALL